NRDARLGRQSRRQTVLFPIPLAAGESTPPLRVVLNWTSLLPHTEKRERTTRGTSESFVLFVFFPCAFCVPFPIRYSRTIFQLSVRRFNKLRRRFSMFIFPFLHYLRRPDANR